MNRKSSLLKTSAIESSKVFPRLAETTQVVFPNLGQKEIITTRFKHSYEVRTSSMMMVESLNTADINVDYQKAIENVSLLHDIGHCPFGHEGAKILDKSFKEKGLEEGFDDNSNNFTVLEKAQLGLEPYDLASLIKYPDKLYEEQKTKYLKYLSDSIDEDIKYFTGKVEITKRPKRTVACEIMDEADRNTYTCSDLSDCFCLGLGKIEPFEELQQNAGYFSYEVQELLSLVISAIKSNDKSLIKRAFCKVKDALNQNYILGKNLKLKPLNEELIDLREAFFKIEIEIYIDAEEILKQRENCKKYLEFYIDAVCNKGFCPSKTYTQKIALAKNKKEILSLQRDMIAEVTDWYVVNYYNNFNK